MGLSPPSRGISGACGMRLPFLIQSSFRRSLSEAAARPELLALLPALTLAAYWLGGEGWLVITALAVPVAFAGAAAQGTLSELSRLRAGYSDDTQLPLREALLAEVEDNLETCQIVGLHCGVVVFILDRADSLRDTHGRTAVNELVDHMGRKLRHLTRSADFVARLDDITYGVALGPQEQSSRCEMIATARRLQMALTQRLRTDAGWLDPSVSVGLSDTVDQGQTEAQTMLQGAEIAAERALNDGPGALCIYQRGMQSDSTRQAALRDALSRALGNGEIGAVFQPQVCAVTGALTGMEALVRWSRDGQVIPPSDFLPQLHSFGLSEGLTRRMLAQALDALEAGDAIGQIIPNVALNLSRTELLAPGLADLILWDLDRRGLQPERLVIEVLESVVADPADGVIERNIAALARAGCGIDLDDFGTGHASIANIRRFAVGRLKIDRSFVSGLDTDPAQRRLVGAIVLMARELRLGTVAEGVETAAEAKALADLGCEALQGYHIARPLPLSEIQAWLRADSRRHARPGSAGPATAETAP